MTNTDHRCTICGRWWHQHNPANRQWCADQLELQWWRKLLIGWTPGNMAASALGCGCLGIVFLYIGVIALAWIAIALW